MHAAAAPEGLVPSVQRVARESIMNIACSGMRDRRVAASDETVSVRGADSRVYRRGSVAYAGGAHAARARGRRAARYDRQPGDIRAVILHQTSGGTYLSGRPARRLARTADDGRLRSASNIDRIAAHFVVLQDGTIFYTHDVQFLIDSAGGRHGIDIEVCGRFPTSATPDPSSRLPTEAIRALRALLTALKQQLPAITHIHPHGQVQSVDMIVTEGTRVASACGAPGSANPCSKLVSCPGPDIWVNVGAWACEASPVGLGLISASPPPGYQNNGIQPELANAAYEQDV
jgi:N-acetylmuramoyl-L-alanine amidase